MVKALYLMSKQPYDLVYPKTVQTELAALADIYAPVQTNDVIKHNPELLQDVEVIFSGWGGPKLDQEFLAAAPNLKALFYAAGSIKQIATEDSWEREIVISSAADANAVPVAEYSISQIIFCLKNGWQLVREIERNHQYPNKSGRIPGAFKRTVGIISLSKVGRHVCERLKHFDLNVIAYDPFASREEAEALGVELCSLEELFQQADIVSLHTPLLKETIGMIKGEHFEQMKSGASFINTARGAIVCEDELIDVFSRREDLTAVLDVTSPEPPKPDSPLYTMQNVVLTPHLAGSEGEECGRMGSYMLEEFKRYQKGEPLKWQVTREEFVTMA